MGKLERTPRPETRRAYQGTIRYGDWQARKIASLAGEQSDNTEDETDAQLFAEWLLIERNRWDIGRRQGASGIFANNKRWDRRDAERAWSAVCSKQREIA